MSSTTLDNTTAPPDGDPIDLAGATTLIASAALRESPPGPVGIELEGHVHHRDDTRRPLQFDPLAALATELTPLPTGGRVTLEPGGQLEVSSAVHPDVGTAIAATRAEVVLVERRLAELDLTWTFVGTDPWREPQRINPAARYRCMEAWFDGCGRGAVPGRTMMCATAGLQVNLEAGTREQWATRVRRASALGPLLTALTGSSRWLSGRDTGLHSARQQAWAAMDPRISGPLADADDPVAAWTARVLAAPVLEVSGPDGVVEVDRCRSLTEWLTDPADWPTPTAADVVRHLSLQFPPLRLRGFLELRCCDALPEPWWPAVVLATVTWMDDARAEVDALLAPIADRWEPAYTVGLADADLQRAAVGCLEVAADLTGDAVVAELLALARAGTSPGVAVGR